ncbi:hypothetical protein GMORB2_5287 [Geosmithia morbida]|uniref:Uncharacterized protein n=1 Tax=Geosmithia morbida TaxID=1094350 RepID=A0A9P5D5J8_9HYPO|nr:uncharacterized protein GMORB2_5287 [Geosmithia morbida]KAF4124621.1 hypothetical protein GMORB2_5287 [Geosmithia morbida]
MHSAFMVQLASMGLNRERISTGPTTYPMDGHGSRGEADSAGLPLSRHQEDTWPTIVFESGYSQSQSSLRQKMRFWSSRSAHQVKTVILVEVDPGSDDRRISIDPWRKRPPSATIQVPSRRNTDTRIIGGLESSARLCPNNHRRVASPDALRRR